MRPARLSRPATITVVVVLAALMAVVVTFRVRATSGPQASVTAAEPPRYCDDPTGAVLLRIETDTGYPLPFAEFWLQPEISLYDDGTLIVTHPDTDELLVSHLSCDQRFNFVERSVAAGIRDQPPDVGNDQIIEMLGDWTTTTFSLAVDTGLVETDGRQVVTDEPTVIWVHAIDLSDGLNAQQRANRAALFALREDLRTLAVETAERYEPVTLSVLVQPFVGEGQSDVPPRLLEWPLGDLAGSLPQEDAYGCEVVSGTDLTALGDLIPHPGAVTLWESGGQLYDLTFRTDLPDQVACKW